MDTLKFLLSELERLSDQQRLMVDVLRENERLKQQLLELESKDKHNDPASDWRPLPPRPQREFL